MRMVKLRSRLLVTQDKYMGGTRPTRHKQAAFRSFMGEVTSTAKAVSSVAKKAGSAAKESLLRGSLRKYHQTRGRM